MQYAAIYISALYYTNVLVSSTIYTHIPHTIHIHIYPNALTSGYGEKLKSVQRSAYKRGGASDSSIVATILLDERMLNSLMTMPAPVNKHASVDSLCTNIFAMAKCTTG